nr:hypothetical protein [Escherichia coli]
MSSKSQSWTVRWGNQADQQCQLCFQYTGFRTYNLCITRHSAVPLRIKMKRAPLITGLLLISTSCAYARLAPESPDNQYHLFK